VTIDPTIDLRLQFLVRVLRKEYQHLVSTDQRLFNAPFTQEQARQLEADADLAERVEAFVGRFGRLQDTIGDKLLPVFLMALGETPAAAIDNLDKAERLGLIASADEWMALRRLRNQMVHEYIEDLTLRASALQSGHDGVPMLVSAAKKLLAEVERRGWI
jgi:hypothetical protein